MKDIAQMLHQAYEEGLYDPMVEETLKEAIDYVEHTPEYIEAENNDEYIDTSELGGHCGHYADESMYNKED